MKILKTIFTILLIIFEPMLFTIGYTHVVGPLDMWGWGYSQGELSMVFYLNDIFSHWWISMYFDGFILQLFLTVVIFGIVQLIMGIHTLVND